MMSYIYGGAKYKKDGKLKYSNPPKHLETYGLLEANTSINEEELLQIYENSIEVGDYCLKKNGLMYIKFQQLAIDWHVEITKKVENSQKFKYVNIFLIF